jgi:cytochrome c-type biogenesis protein CcmH/NrfF
MRFLRPTHGTAVTGKTKPRFRLLYVALWIALVGALLVCFTFLNAPSGGSPPWVVSVIVSWLPFVALVGVWLWYSRASRRSSSGTSWVDLYEQQVAENKRTNALLERIAAALEKPSPG